MSATPTRVLDNKVIYVQFIPQIEVSNTLIWYFVPNAWVKLNIRISNRAIYR
jgi:hypothetical protein